MGQVTHRAQKKLDIAKKKLNKWGGKEEYEKVIEEMKNVEETKRFEKEDNERSEKLFSYDN